MDQVQKTDLLARLGYTAYHRKGGGKTYNGQKMPSWDDLAKAEHGKRTCDLWGAGADAIARAERAILALTSIAAGESTILSFAHTMGRVVRSGDNPAGTARFTLLGKQNLTLEQAVEMIALHGLPEVASSASPADESKAEPASSAPPAK